MLDGSFGCKVGSERNVSNAPDMADIKSLLAAKKCADLIHKCELIVLDSELALHDACQTLAAHKISSAPVFDKTSKTYIGMLDYRDIVAHVLTVLHKIPNAPPSFDAAWSVSDVVKVALAKGPGNVSVKV